MKSILNLIIVSLILIYTSCKNNQKIDFEVTSQQIYKEYQDNEVAADAKYKDKRIKVTGTIISFDKSMGVNYCYIGSPGDFIGEVRCAMSEEFTKEAGNYKNGQIITLEGNCVGKSLTGVVNIE